MDDDFCKVNGGRLSGSKILLLESVSLFPIGSMYGIFRCCSDFIEPPAKYIYIDIYTYIEAFSPSFLLFFREISNFARIYRNFHFSPPVRIKGVLFSIHGESLLDWILSLKPFPVIPNSCKTPFGWPNQTRERATLKQTYWTCRGPHQISCNSW